MYLSPKQIINGHIVLFVPYLLMYKFNVIYISVSNSLMSQGQDICPTTDITSCTANTNDSFLAGCWMSANQLEMLVNIIDRLYNKDYI